MKKIKYFIFTSICLMLSVFLTSYQVQGENIDGSYYQVSEKSTFNFANLEFSQLTFISNTDSDKSYGITGKVINNSNSNVYYKAKINYYNAEQKCIIEAENTYMALPGENLVNFLFNVTDTNKQNVENIQYYSIEISNMILPSKSTEDLSNEYNSYDYVIGKYDINIKLSENNEFDVTETIDTYFNVAKHGIYRTIPLKNYLIRDDDSQSITKARIRNIKIDSSYSKSYENDNVVLKIGDEDQMFTGEKTYTIKYKYSLNKDDTSLYDELYYNIIGTSWDTIIGNITFSIEMPTDFDASKLGFSSGTEGSSLNNVIYTVQGNKIIGTYNGILNPNEAITVRCELPEGYFTYPKRLSFYYYIFIFLIAAFLLISVYLWYKNGKDDKVIETVEFYPPDNLNSAELSFAYKGLVQNNDIVSLLIYLASKGYIKIIETDSKNLFGKSKKFKIQKVKEYDGTNENEKMFFNGLFQCSKSTISLFDKKNNDALNENTKNEVSSDDLKDNFYVTINEILRNINSSVNKNAIFEKSVNKLKALVILMIIISLCLVTIPPIYYYGDMDFTLVFLIGCSFSGIFIISNGVFKSKEESGFKIFGYIIEKIISCIGGLLFLIVPFFLIGWTAISYEKGFLLGYIFGAVCSLIMFIFCKLLTKRTKYGIEILGKIRGFKNFLETAEKDKLEALVLENPTYFYDILPYTYVLGISDKWIKKFETIAIGEPDWYVGTDPFDIVMFNHVINSTMDTAKAAMLSTPHEASGGGFSGGGFSGGGSGGGGGGSW